MPPPPLLPSHLGLCPRLLFQPLAVLQSHFAVNYGALCTLYYEYVGGGIERRREREDGNTH